MSIRTTIIVFVAALGISLVTVSAMAQQFNFRVADPPRAAATGGGNNASTTITCPKCKQQYRYGTNHVCPPKPQPPKSDPWADFAQGLAEGVAKGLEEANQWTNCRNCGQRIRVDQIRTHRCPPTQQTKRVLTCQNCGTRYYEGQNHRCPQQTQPQKPTVTTGNPLPPAKPTVGTGNPNTLKLADLDRRNIDALRRSFLDPLIDKQIEDIKKNMPDDSAIAIQIGGLQPPLSGADSDALMQAVRDGDTDKVKDILKNHDKKDLATFTGLAEVKDLIKKYDKDGTIKQSDIKKILDSFKNGNQTFLDNLLSSNVQSLGKINKISKILDLASVVIGGGSGGSNIPTGVVAIVTFPDLPYGVVFPLGNGVWGIGTGGKGIVGIWQGYIPQPPIYGGNSIVVDTEKKVDMIIYNGTGEDIRYYVHNSSVTTLENGRLQNWSIDSYPNRIQVRLPSGRGNNWITSQHNPGTYEFTKSQNGGWTLKEVKTEVTIKNTGNPIPFTFFIGDDKYVIEPGKDIQLNDPKGGNSVYNIQFARSSDTEDVARHAVGGKMICVVGRDESDGKWSLFHGRAEQKKPSAPQQNTTAANSTLTYDDTPISSTNLGGLPVLPSYD